MSSGPLPMPDLLPHRTALPVFLSIPHSGRVLPDWLLAQAAVGRAALESLGDPFVDRLAGKAIAEGHGAIVARAARAAIDCNRAPDDLDPAMLADTMSTRPTHRARAGLGLVPDRTALHGRLWSSQLRAADVACRIAQAHAPFHAAIERSIDTISIASGQSLLLDCHSMPPRRGQAELVIGDLHGRSAGPWVTREAVAIARSAGWSVAVNQPYAGGFVVQRHGRPEQGRHALQVEICRSVYLDAAGRPGPGFDRASALLATLSRSLGIALLPPAALAAE